MKLEQLLRALEPHTLLGPADSDITGIAADSRRVAPGQLFVAVRGLALDGAQFASDALARGAAAVVAETMPAAPLPAERAWVVVPDSRAALAQLAAAWHHYPSRNLRVIGVTGTDGKTTTSTLIENILLASGHTVGTITTVAAHIGGREVDTGFHTTTPDAPEVQAYLAQMVEAGTEYAVVEATSHGLAQHRLGAVDFDVGVVTNITHEHLDYHKTWENYRDAKALLFKSLMTTRRKPRTPKVAVLNDDDVEHGVFQFLRQIPADERIIYSQAAPSNAAGDASPGQDQPAAPADEIRITAYGISHSPSGLRFGVTTPYGPLTVESSLLGRYNVSNILAAVGVGLARRLPFEAIAEGVRLTRAVPGRMERIDAGQPFTVIVDFAHTPNALDNALKTARDLVTGRVIVVFGCAGLRDVQKRPWMGEIAGRLADLTIVTAEDPRTESLTAINAEIEQGLHKAGRVRDRDYFIIEDRGEAITFAIQKLAQPGDLVIICGKGHERSMCYGTTEYPWSDQDAARTALQTIT